MFFSLDFVTFVKANICVDMSLCSSFRDVISSRGPKYVTRTPVRMLVLLAFQKMIDDKDGAIILR